MSNDILHHIAPSKNNRAKEAWYTILYVQVLIAVGLGILIGYLFPQAGSTLKPLADGFIKLVKMLIAPIVFCTIVHGIASIGDIKKLGRIGLKSFVYFEVVSTFALVIGLVVVNILKPGKGFTPPGEIFQAVNAVGVDTSNFTNNTAAHTSISFILAIIPNSLFSPFVSGEILQVLFVAILVACAIASLGESRMPVLDVVDQATKILFRIMHIVVRAAPIGAFGAMGYTVGSYGLDSLNHLLLLMAGFYLTAILFVLFVLGGIAAYCGFSILHFIRFIKEELLLVLGTSSSEVALPGLMEKMQALGCSRSTVGLVVPAGFSFNLDGTNIYMSMAAIFLAQATNTPLSMGEQLGLLAVALLTSKGASGVTGAGFVTLAATLQVVPSIPLESLAILVGIDRFMSECRALTNLIGNGVATAAISRWEGELTAEELRAKLSSPILIETTVYPTENIAASDKRQSIDSKRTSSLPTQIDSDFEGLMVQLPDS